MVQSASLIRNSPMALRTSAICGKALADASAPGSLTKKSIADIATQ
jgi:hypothetical protein